MRLIDADELILAFGVSDDDIIAKETINDAPTIDAVPVVRCRECKHWNFWEACGHPKNGWDSPHMGPDDFCSYGEKVN